MTDTSTKTESFSHHQSRSAAFGFKAYGNYFLEVLALAGGLAVFNSSQWYYCDDDAERWFSPCDGATREQAAAAALINNRCVIGRGVKGLTRFKIDADDLIARALDDGLEEEIGEDGEHGLADVSPEAVAELQAMLDATVTAWVIRHQVTAFNFVECHPERLDGAEK